MKKIPVFLFIFLFTCSLAFAGELTRPAEWAVPIKLSGAGNLHKIDDHLYRSEQPSRQGMINLEKMGIKTIINLRPFHSDQNEIEGTKLISEHIKIMTWDIEDEDIIKTLKIIRKKEKGPFLVHCQHGADRTGLISAMYRIVVQGWSKDEAIREMKEGGYGFHAVWINISDYIKKADIEKIKKDIAGQDVLMNQ